MPVESNLPAARTASGPPTIVVAEDDDAFRRLVVAELCGAGYRVVESRNGSELLDYIECAMLYGARYSRPSLVISDICMPGLTGFDLFEGLKRARCLVPVIFITAFGSEATVRRARELGALAIFDKPFDIDVLCESVRQHVPLN